MVRRSEKGWIVGPMLVCFGLSAIALVCLFVEIGVVQVKTLLSPLAIFFALTVIAFVILFVKCKSVKVKKLILPACACLAVTGILSLSMLDEMGKIEISWPRLPQLERRPMLDQDTANALLWLDAAIKYEQYEQTKQLLELLQPKKERLEKTRPKTSEKNLAARDI